MVKNSFNEKTYVVYTHSLELPPHRGNSNVHMYLQHNVTENKEENYLEICIFQVLYSLYFVFTSIKHP